MMKKVWLQEDWLTLALALAMPILVSLAIGQANLVESIDMTMIIVGAAFIGFLSGLALARSRFPAITAYIYASVYCFFSSTVLIGQIDSVYSADMLWRERLADIITRQSDWLTKLINGGTSRDALIFVMHTTIIIWILGYSAAWFSVRKQQVWRVILPCGLVLASVIYNYFGPKRQLLQFYFVAYCLAALLYIVLTHLAQNKREWRRKYVQYNRNITSSFLRSGMFIALIAVGIAWIAPPLAANNKVSDSINNINEPWRRFQDQWQRMFSALSATSEGESDPYQESLVLGGPRQQGDSVVMDVYVSDPLLHPYWVGSILDRYQDGAWIAADGQTVRHDPEEPPIRWQSSAARHLVTQKFVNFIPNAATAYAAPDFVHIDKQVTIKGKKTADLYDYVAAVRFRYTLQLGDNYLVTSSESIATQTDLRNASAEYPPDITQNYLALPDTITPRTLELAKELTKSYDNNYDKTIAVRDFLRKNMKYNDQIAAPPKDKEPVDYFLFETQEGYCNYYASAMALMLRSQGIPTRMGRGYASGEYKADSKLYRVRARDAHTWPEVYFAGFGWIPFEPTVIIDPSEIPLGSEAAPPTPDPIEEQKRIDELLKNRPTPTPSPTPKAVAPLNQQKPTAEPQNEKSSHFFLQAFLAFLVMLVAGVLILIANLSNRRIEGDVVSSYGRLALWARWLGIHFQPQHTPEERAEILKSAVPNAEVPVKKLTSEYARLQYSADKKPNAFLDTLHEWKVLRPLFIDKLARRYLPSWLYHIW